MDWWLCRLQIKIKLKPMSEILSLAPQNVWKHFYALTQVPRPSGHLAKFSRSYWNLASKQVLKLFRMRLGTLSIASLPLRVWRIVKP